MSYRDKNEFQTLKNFRDLGGYRLENGGETVYGSFARCAVPLKSDLADRETLLRLGYRHDLDLRTEAETANVPDVYRGDAAFTYTALPFDFVLRDLFFLPEECAAYYLLLLRLRDNVRAILEYCASAPRGVFLHCHAGKDRCGMTAALLLLIAGVRREEIVADYRATFDVYYKNKTPEELAKTRLVPNGINMEIVLDEFTRLYGDIGGYLDYIALPPGAALRIRDKLTIPQ